MTERRRPDGRPQSGSERSTQRLLRRALSSLGRVLAEMLDNEAIAQRPGLLQGLDPRAKVIGLLALLLATASTHHLGALVVAGGLVLALAAASRLPLRRLLATWSMVPLFSAAIVAPALLNWVTPGRPLLHLGWGLTITDAGLHVALRFILRGTVCVTTALLLSATTRSDRLLGGLRALGVPAIFIVLLSMMERYLMVLLRVAEELELARLSRTLSPGSLRDQQQSVAADMGALYRRTSDLSRDVYLAMIARGYRGEARLLDAPRLRARDVAFVALSLVVGAALCWGSWI